MATRKSSKKPQTHKNTDRTFVACLGASAGGLEALQIFFNRFANGSNVAFIIIEHLSINFRSKLPELLAKKTNMPVLEIKNKMAVKPGNIYFLPGGLSLNIRQGHFAISKSKSLHDFPIDTFMFSLAEEYKEQSIGIVLSGTGSDGTAGVKAIKEAGGIVMVQDPGTARFDGMPRNAIRSGVADYMLPVGELAQKLATYVEFFPVLKKVPIEKADDMKMVEQILKLVHRKTHHNFSTYKQPTLLRRIARRMALKGIKNISDYYQLLEKEITECHALSKDFLIGVTRFFRDPQAFAILQKKVIPDLISRKPEGDLIKAWCIACSTGEEAYSIAISFQEALRRTNKDIAIKLFATDVDEESLTIASKGTYPLNIEADVDHQLLKRYFHKHQDSYQINAEIRRMVIFSKHNIAEDPPFHRIHFIACRNILIYMKPELQQKVFSRIHFGLNVNGYLMLGPNEALGAMEPYFTTIDKKWKIFKNKEVARTIGQDFNNLTSTELTLKAQQNLRNNPMQNLMKDYRVAASVNELLFSQYDLACVVVDKHNNVQQAIGNCQSTGKGYRWRH